MIRLTARAIEEDDLKAVWEVLASGFLVQGPRVAEFEEAVAGYVGTKYAIAVSSCTAALHLALLAIDLRPGDLVLVPSYSWPATSNVIELCRAQPVFVDIQSDTFNMDPNCLEMLLKRLMGVEYTARRVKAIMPVHSFGQMADMPAILELANAYDLPVLEDAACALGAGLYDKQAGSYGLIGCFSFHPRKAITTGEGGIIVTEDGSVAHRLRALRNHGQDPDSSAPDFVLPGFNYRMTELQAALGLTQLAKLDRIITARRRGAAVYDELLDERQLQIPAVAERSKHVYQSYVVLLPHATAPNRSSLISHLRQRGIETTLGTWHIPLTTFFSTQYGYRSGDFPETDQIFARSLSLPLYEQLSSQQQQEVSKTLLQAI
jgi:dTDP-4-amino-4,6-dideoxygalactose transaminase